MKKYLFLMCALFALVSCNEFDDIVKDVSLE